MIQNAEMESDRVVIGAVYDTNGTSETSRYVYSPRGIHAMEDDLGEWSYPLVDGLNSNRVEVEADLDIVASGSYQPYGVPFGENGTFNLPHRFTGEWRDEVTELQNHRARYYAPNMGTWLSQDLLETSNRYAYVNGNPINLTDSSGLISSNRCWETCMDNPCAFPLTGDNCRSDGNQLSGKFFNCFDACQEYYSTEYNDPIISFLQRIQRDVDIIPQLILENPRVALQAIQEFGCQQNINLNLVGAIGTTATAGTLAGGAVVSGGGAIPLLIIGGTLLAFPLALLIGSTRTDEQDEDDDGPCGKVYTNNNPSDLQMLADSSYVITQRPITRRGGLRNATAYLYTVTLNGQVRLGNVYQAGLDSIILHHPDLVNGVPVAYAGEITFYNNSVTRWDNRSGHYLPNFEHDQEESDCIKRLIERAGWGQLPPQSWAR